MKYCLIGIVTFQREKLLEKSIESALKALPENSDVVVFDNSPSEQSRNISKRNPNVRWIFSSENIGCIPARTQLMSTDEYEFYVSLDDDAWFVEGDELAAALELMEQNQSVAGVSFDILSPDRPNADSKKRESVVVRNFIGCGHVLRLEDVHQVKSYAPSVGIYGSEEKDLSLRLLNIGKQIVSLRGHHVWHDKSELGRDIFVQYRSEVCNDLSLNLRRVPGVFLPPVLVWKTLQHFLFALRMKRLSPYRAGLSLFIGNFFEILKDRAPVKLETLRKFKQLSNY